MAKAKFNLSQAVRDAIAENKNGSAKDVIEAIRKAHPGVKFKETTASVTWSKLRGSKKKSKRVLKPRHHENGAMSVLDAAAELVRVSGGLDQARNLLEKLEMMAVTG